MRSPWNCVVCPNLGKCWNLLTQFDLMRTPSDVVFLLKTSGYLSTLKANWSVTLCIWTARLCRPLSFYTPLKPQGLNQSPAAQEFPWHPLPSEVFTTLGTDTYWFLSNVQERERGASGGGRRGELNATLTTWSMLRSHRLAVFSDGLLSSLREGLKRPPSAWLLFLWRSLNWARSTPAEVEGWE